jgi:hypothetical protein
MAKAIVKLVAATTAALMMSGAAMAAEKTDMDGIKTPAGKVINDYLKMFFTECNRAGAVKKYQSDKIVEHGWLGNGAKEPTMAEMEAMGMGGGAAPQGGAGAPPAGAAPQGAPPQGGDMGAMPAPGAAGGKCEPDADILKVMVQGDLVFVQAHGHQSKPGGDLLWILYRVKDGKIVEHWDTHNEIPAAQIGKQW